MSSATQTITLNSATNNNNSNNTNISSNNTDQSYQYQQQQQQKQQNQQQQQQQEQQEQQQTTVNREKHTVHWFRRGLRLHDNPALLEGIKNSTTFRCVFLIDPWFAGNSNVGINKWRFLLQCLDDLDRNLRKLNSRLFVIRGQPADALPKLFKEWGTNFLTFEEDPEPFGRVRDHNITEMCKELNIEVFQAISHTLYKLENIIEKNGGRAPLTYHQFQAVIASMDPPPHPEPPITQDTVMMTYTPINEDHDEKYGVPTLEELGFETGCLKPPVWEGGETEALARLERHLERKAWVASFGRPKMTPQSLLASQTGLSPYLRFGCLSTRLFYYQLTDLYKQIKKACPPLSLHGQLLWREFFYCAATKNSNFDKMIGNPICVQIPWDRNAEALAKWANGQTGFPWIDAVMTQLREEGWIHHLARHAVACFLSRGDLWISWEEGMKVFEELLLDADWSVNAGMWMWLSCSSFFQQFFHCYCPVRFGRKADPNGDYIRKYLPVLKNFPTKYIHEPWNAPESIQRAAKCIIGQDYSMPIVNHAVASRVNMERMKQVYHQLAKYRACVHDEKVKGGSPFAKVLNTVKSAQFINNPSPTTVIANVNNTENYGYQNPNNNFTIANNLKNSTNYHHQLNNPHQENQQPLYIINQQNTDCTKPSHQNSINNPNGEHNLKSLQNFNENQQENHNPQYNRIILHRNTTAYNSNQMCQTDVLNNQHIQNMQLNRLVIQQQQSAKHNHHPHHNNNNHQYNNIYENQEYKLEIDSHYSNYTSGNNYTNNSARTGENLDNNCENDNENINCSSNNNDNSNQQQQQPTDNNNLNEQIRYDREVAVCKIEDNLC